MSIPAMLAMSIKGLGGVPPEHASELPVLVMRLGARAVWFCTYHDEIRMTATPILVNGLFAPGNDSPYNGGLVPVVVGSNQDIVEDEPEARYLDPDDYDATRYLFPGWPHRLTDRQAGAQSAVLKPGDRVRVVCLDGSRWATNETRYLSHRTGSVVERHPRDPAMWLVRLDNSHVDRWFDASEFVRCCPCCDAWIVKRGDRNNRLAEECLRHLNNPASCAGSNWKGPTICG